MLSGSLPTTHSCRGHTHFRGTVVLRSVAVADPCEALGAPPCVSALPTSCPRPTPFSISQTFAPALPSPSHSTPSRRVSALLHGLVQVPDLLRILPIPGCGSVKPPLQEHFTCCGYLTFFTLKSLVHSSQTRTTKFQSPIFFFKSSQTLIFDIELPLNCFCQRRGRILFQTPLPAGRRLALVEVEVDSRRAWCGQEWAPGF